MSKQSFKYLIIIFAASIFFIQCSKDTQKIKKPEKIIPLEILYKDAKNLFDNGEWNESLKLFKKVEIQYSFSEWAPKATLMIIYIYYESGESVKALEYIEKFKKFHPSHKNMDYVDFIKALVFYDQISIPSKDISHAKNAQKEFEILIKKYPSSIYSDNAKLKIDLIREQIAAKEMYIARYYMEKKKWLSALKRLNVITENYKNTIFIKEAYHRKVEIYYKIGNTKEAKKNAAILGYNFNDSDWYKKSYQIVTGKDYVLENKKQRINIKKKLLEIFKFSK
jgi:outer membrane protein assembly factor BamD